MRPRLMQLLKDNSGRGQALRSEAAGAEVEIFLYDVIDAWFGISATAFATALRAAGDKPVVLRVNSPGGDVFEGRAMASLIAQRAAPVRVMIDGLAASAASTVALAAPLVEMARGAFLMVHKSWSLTMGNADELRDLAKLLDKIDGEIAADYARRAKVDAAQAMAWMAAETWFTAEEARDAGLIDAVAAQQAAANRFDMSAFANAPAALAARPDADARHRAALERRLRLFEAA